MSVWYEGSNEIACSLDQVKRAMEDFGAHYVGLVRLMPGLQGVELVGQGPDHVLIQTNEGLMKRMNIVVRIEDDLVVVRFDEEYRAGLIGVVRTHYLNEFEKSETGVRHRVVLSDIDARGILGFLYRSFGSSSTGKAVLASNKAYFEGTL